MTSRSIAAWMGVVASGWCAPARAAFTRQPWIQDATQASVTIAWEAGAAGGTQKVAYGVGAATDVSADGTLVSNRLYEARIAPLPPGTRFSYQVTSGSDSSGIGSFVTAPASAAPFRFGCTGDNRSDSAGHASVVQATIPFAPDFMLNTGDIVDGSDYVDFFAVEAPLLRDTVLFPAPGNHDGVTQYTYGFDCPPYYSFRWSNAFFVSLSNDVGYTPGTPQYAWAEGQLQAAKADATVEWIFVYHHYPVYSSGNHGSTGDVITGLNELYKTYGVDVVINGHDHDYERVERDGIVYLVTGGGGVGLSTFGPPVSGQKYAESVRHVLVADVDGGVLHLQAYRTDGTLMDERVLEKGPPTGAPGDPGVPGDPSPPGEEAGDMGTVHGSGMCAVSPARGESPAAGAEMLALSLALLLARRRYPA